MIAVAPLRSQARRLAPSFQAPVWRHPQSRYAREAPARWFPSERPSREARHLGDASGRPWPRRRRAEACRPRLPNTARSSGRCDRVLRTCSWRAAGNLEIQARGPVSIYPGFDCSSPAAGVLAGPSRFVRGPTLAGPVRLRRALARAARMQQLLPEPPGRRLPARHRLRPA